jgi:DNA-binding CsgD family transcriptional regulator
VGEVGEVRLGSSGDGSSPLSGREREISELIGQGLTNSEIAQVLVISRRTVESHVDHIKAKLGLARRAHVVRWALARGTDDGR